MQFDRHCQALSGLGLQRHERAFVENGVDGAMLLDIVQHDGLADLGVRNVVHQVWDLCTARCMIVVGARYTQPFLNLRT